MNDRENLSTHLTAYLNDKYVDFRLQHFSNGGVGVMVYDLGEKMWAEVIGPEMVLQAAQHGFYIAVVLRPDNLRAVFINNWGPMDFAKQGHVLEAADMDGIDYYQPPPVL